MTAMHRLIQIILTSLLAAATGRAQPWAVPEDKMHRGPDPVARIELAGPRYPTFESVARHYPMLNLPREALGVFESAREFVVTRWGELALNNLGMDKPGQPEAYPNNSPENVATLYFTLRCGDGPETRYGEGNPADAKRLAEGYLPIVLVPFTHGGIECVQTLFAWAQDMDPDGRLWAYAGLELRNRAAANTRVTLAHRAECGRRPRRVQIGSWDFDLAPGATRRFCVRIPRDGIVPDTEITAESPEYKKRGTNARLPFCGGIEGVEPVAPPEYDRRLAEVAAAWRARLGEGMTISVPEQRVNDAWRAWLAYGFINVDKEAKRYLPHDGSGFYDLVLGIAAIQFCRALDLYGYHEHARRCLDSICELVEPTGELKTYFGLSDSGTLLVALRDHY